MSYNVETSTVTLSDASNAFLIDQSSPMLRNCDVEFVFNPLEDSGSFRVVARYQGDSSYTAVGVAALADSLTHKADWQAWNNAG